MNLPFDATCFNLFVQEFAAAFPESLNLLQLDQAGAHCALDVDLEMAAHTPLLAAWDKQLASRRAALSIP
jgi:hypothetical protein